MLLPTIFSNGSNSKRDTYVSCKFPTPIPTVLASLLRLPTTTYSFTFPPPVRCCFRASFVLAYNFISSLFPRSQKGHTSEDVVSESDRHKNLFTKAIGGFLYLDNSIIYCQYLQPAITLIFPARFTTLFHIGVFHLRSPSVMPEEDLPRVIVCVAANISVV